MKLIVIERFRDLETKSKEFPQGKDREIDEIFDVDDKRAKVLLAKGWVKKADNICDDKKTKKDDSIKENHDDDEKNIENANSNIDNQPENINDDDKDIEKK